jgi:hypothetical protein
MVGPSGHPPIKSPSVGPFSISYPHSATPPTLQKLGIRYRPQYNTRHTVWSHAIAGSEDVPPMPIAEAAKYAGNRPETMMRQYLGAVTQSEMPDLIGDTSTDTDPTEEDEAAQ